jgi:hypothetical protein
MKMCGGNGGIDPPFLTFAVHGDDWSALRTGCFTPGEGAHSTYWRRLGVPQNRSGHCGIQKKSSPTGNGIPAFQP